MFPWELKHYGENECAAHFSTDSLIYFLGLMDSGGNPWTGVSAFTANMTPAPNPNNPFL